MPKAIRIAMFVLSLVLVVMIPIVTINIVSDNLEAGKGPVAVVMSTLLFGALFVWAARWAWLTKPS